MSVFPDACLQRPKGGEVRTPSCRHSHLAAVEWKLGEMGSTEPQDFINFAENGVVCVVKPFLFLVNVWGITMKPLESNRGWG